MLYKKDCHLRQSFFVHYILINTKNYLSYLKIKKTIDQFHLNEYYSLKIFYF